MAEGRNEMKLTTVHENEALTPSTNQQNEFNTCIKRFSVFTWIKQKLACLFFYHNMLICLFYYHFI